MFTKAFWKATAERAVKTFAQTVIAAAGIATVDVAALDVLHTTWQTDLELGGVAAALSVLTSLISYGVRGDGPSLAGETTAAPATEPDNAALAYVSPDDEADAESTL